MKQLLLFEEPLEKKYERKAKELEEKQDKLRKKLFAENNALKKEIRELKSKFEVLEANICKGKMIL